MNDHDPYEQATAVALSWTPTRSAKTLLVWRWEDAPEALRKLSDHGGDEEWVLYAPPGYAAWIGWADGGTLFGPCSVSEFRLATGALVLIGAH